MALNREQQVIADSVKSLLDLLPVFSELEKQIDNNPTNLSIMANTTFVCRKSKDILEMIEKKLNHLESHTAAQAMLVLPHVEDHKHSTEYCTISDNSEFYIKHPTQPANDGSNPDKIPTEEEIKANTVFTKFVKELVERNPYTVRPHYPTVIREISIALQNGEQIPFGLDKERIKGITCKLRMRAKKEL